MSDHKQLTFLRDKGFVPELYSLDDANQIELQKFLNLSHSDKERIRDSAIVVIDGAQWAASDSPISSDTIPESVSIFSGNGENVFKHTRRTKAVVYKVDESAGLASVDYIHLYTNKETEEEESMNVREMMMNVDGGAGGLGELSVDDLQKELGGAATPEATPQPMNSFNEGDSAPKKDSEPLINRAITDAISQREIANPYALQMFNRKFGRLVGYIVNQDARIEFTTKQTPIIENGQNVLVPTAPEDIRQQFARDGKVSREWLQHEFQIKSRQTKPGKVVGLNVSIPVGGFVDLIKFREPGELRADETQRDLKYLVLSKDLYPSFLDFYFGRGILEHETTHGGEAAGEVNQIPNPRYKKVENQPTKTNIVSRMLKTTKRRSLILPTNYVPLKTYETIRLGGNLTEEQIDTLNLSAFTSLVNAKVPKNMSATKFELLSAEDKTKVQRGADGKITSRFFTNDASSRINLEVTPFWDKDAEFLDVIEMPVKEERVNRESGNITYRYITYLTTDEKVLENPATREKTSLHSGRFKTMIDASNGSITVDSLRELVRRSSRSSKAASITNEEVLKMQLGLADRWFDSSLLEFADKPEGGFATVSEKIYSLRVDTIQS